MSTGRRAASACGRAAALWLAIAHPFTGTARAEEPALENVVVTGTRLARADFVSPSPIVTVPSAAFEQTGGTSVAQTLDLYPQFVPTAGATSNNPGNDGAANVSLRGLGANRTLVLLDGRRLIPADGNGAVDLNVIPAALVERVEVVTGGASAVYGSDAIGGVVNVALKHHFDGVQLDAGGSLTERGDGAEYSAGITGGTSFASGRGSVLAYIGYAERGEVDQDARSFSRYPLEYVAGYTGGLGPGGSFIGSGSPVAGDGFHIVFPGASAFDQVFASYGYGPGTVPFQPAFGVNADGTLFTFGTGAPGSVVNYRGVRDPVLFNDRQYSIYNYAPDTALQMPLERRSAFVHGTFDLDESTDLYAQALYADYTVVRRLAPAEIGILLIPPTNPFAPADLRTLLASRPVPSAPYRYFRRASEVGPRAAENQRDVIQVTAGLRGRVAGTWQYDVYVQFGENDRTERQTNSVSLGRLQDLTFAPDGGVSICEGGFDPYRAGSLSRECAAYIAVDASNHVTLQQTLSEVSIAGPLAQLPAGELRMATGVFYKRDRFVYDADPAASAVLPGVPGVIGPRPDVAGFAAAPDRAGTESNVDAYVELRVPIARDRGGLHSLEVDLGYRYSDYTQAGGVGSYKAELLYSPWTPLRLRGSYQHAVRAPSIEELYYPPVANQFQIPLPEPCDIRSDARKGPDAARVEALCLAQGVPAALLQSYQYPLRRVDGVSGGNPDLRPEQADTYTIGFVFTAPSSRTTVRDLQGSVDAYLIRIDQGIGRWDAESAVNRCFDPRYNPGYDPGNVYCSFFTRDRVTGNIYAEVLDRNIGGLETAGVDLQFEWGFDAGPGALGINALVTYVDRWTYRDPSGGTIEYAGTIGGTGLGRSLPRWKSLLQVSYDVAGFGLSARWQHVDGMRDVEEARFAVPPREYLGVDARYRFSEGALRGLQLRVGVENLFDQAPPVFPTWQQANTDPSQYDVLGRRYYARLQYEFD